MDDVSQCHYENMTMALIGHQNNWKWNHDIVSLKKCRHKETWDKMNWIGLQSTDLPFKMFYTDEDDSNQRSWETDKILGDWKFCQHSFNIWKLQKSPIISAARCHWS